MTGQATRSDRPVAPPRAPREHVRRLVETATSLFLASLWLAMWPVPRAWLLGLVRALAPFIARAGRFRVARKNLRIIRSVFPSAWRGRPENRMVAEAIRHQLSTIVDLFKLVASTGQETLALTTIRGWERLEPLLRARRGVVLVAAHQGNWELTGAALAARGVPVHAVYFEQLSPSLDRFLASVRARSGMRLLHRRRGLRECLRVLREGGAVGFVADQDGSRDGIWSDFLGRLVSMPRGPYEFARHAGCPVVPVSCRRLEDNSYEVTVEEPLFVERPDETESVCHRVVRLFETALAAAPEQWQLFYDRFWLRHIPRLAELGLLDRARREAERDQRLAESPVDEVERDRSFLSGAPLPNPREGRSSPLDPPMSAESLALARSSESSGVPTRLQSLFSSPGPGGGTPPGRGPGTASPADRPGYYSPAALLRLAYLFYLPILLASVVWMSFRGRMHAWLWTGAGFELAICLALSVAMSFLTILVSRWLTRCFVWGEQLEEVFREILGPVDVSTAIRLAAISALAEEALFRGALQPELGLFWASLLFGLVHFPAEPRLRPWTGFAFVVGAGLGVLYDVTGGLLAPVLAHFLINAVNLAWLGQSETGSAGPDDDDPSKPIVSRDTGIPGLSTFSRPEPDHADDYSVKHE